MKAVKILSENPEAGTYSAELTCEHCGHTEDAHDLPAAIERRGELRTQKCPKCGKTSNQEVVTQEQAAAGIGANEEAIEELQSKLGGGDSDEDGVGLGGNHPNVDEESEDPDDWAL